MEGAARGDVLDLDPLAAPQNSTHMQQALLLPAGAQGENQPHPPAYNS